MTSEPVPVLVVDDNLDFLRVVQAVLAAATPRFAVHAVTTGRDAVAFLERRPPFADAPRPAFVVLDFYLPDMPAPAVLERVRAREELRAIPVLVLSQASWPEDEAAARTSGAREFRVKPSRTRSLEAAVTTFWKERVHACERADHRG